MSLNTYSDMKETIGRWLDRDDLLSLIPDFISLAQVRINRRLRIMDMENTATTSLITGQTRYALPCGFLVARNIYIDGVDGNLNYLTPDKFVNLDSALTLIGYTIVGDEILLNAEAEGSLVIDYFKSYDTLSTDNEINWLTVNAPDLLLYASLLEAEAYLMTDERIPLWKEAFEISLEDLNNLSIEGRYSGDPMRIRSA
jgi:hypothetical protein